MDGHHPDLVGAQNSAYRLTRPPWIVRSEGVEGLHDSMLSWGIVVVKGTFGIIGMGYERASLCLPRFGSTVILMWK